MMPSRLPWIEFSLILTDDIGIRRPNARYLGHDEPTDVLSFGYPPLPGEGAGSAEVLVNVERALQAGRHRRGGAERELALYIAHGCNHLTGEDDDTPQHRTRMRRRELHWLKDAADAGLLENLFTP